MLPPPSSSIGAGRLTGETVRPFGGCSRPDRFSGRSRLAPASFRILPRLFWDSAQGPMNDYTGWVGRRKQHRSRADGSKGKPWKQH